MFFTNQKIIKETNIDIQVIMIKNLIIGNRINKVNLITIQNLLLF
jgi:hypothetical protein